MIATLMQIQWTWPWAVLLIPIPLLVHRLLPPARRDSGALRLPDGAYLPTDTERGDFAVSPWVLVTIAAVWLLLIAAAARPQLLGDEISAPATGRNLMLAVDLSGSMSANDFMLGQQRVNRLVATKAVAGDFIERRAGDRLGLILFGARAYLQVPLTFDRRSVRVLLNEASRGLAGEKTAIGDAIGLAVKRLRAADDPDSKQVLILLTDGANTAGNIEPLKAAQLAAANDLKIYTIGIGADRADVSSAMGRVQRGRIRSDLDEQTLTDIARMTGGSYFRATDTRTLERIYARLDELEPAATDEQGFRPVIDLYFWPLLAALLITVAAAGVALLAGLVSHRPSMA
ncbi:MAG: VWA domain-containing protein [Pseudomonadota bacterium]